MIPSDSIRFQSSDGSVPTYLQRRLLSPQRLVIPSTKPKELTKLRWQGDLRELQNSPPTPFPCLILTHKHAPWLFKSSFHGDSILKFSSIRTVIIFHLLLLRGNSGKESLLQIKGGVRNKEGRSSSVFHYLIGWESLTGIPLTLSSLPSPHHYPPGVLDHLVLTHLYLDEEIIWARLKGYAAANVFSAANDKGTEHVSSSQIPQCYNW